VSIRLVTLIYFTGHAKMTQNCSSIPLVCNLYL